MKIVTISQIDEAVELIQKLMTLVDGAETIVELYKPEGPAATEWRHRWLANASRAYDSYKDLLVEEK